MRSIRLPKLYFILPFSILLLFFIYQVKGYYYTCLPAMDIAIFNEAISRFWYEGVLNPFGNVRQIKIFNDHIDPIMIIFSPIHALFKYQLVTIICIPFFAILLAFFVLKKKYLLTGFDLFIFYTMIMFSRSVMGELSYPMHPILWSMPVLLMFVKKIMDNNIGGGFCFALFLLLFKETYAFALFGFSFGMLYFYFSHRDKRCLYYGLLSLIISSSYLSWYFFIRPEMMGGKIYNYTGIELGHLTENGVFGFLKVWLLGFDYKTFFTTFLSYFFLFWLNRKSLKKNKNVLILIAWVLPLFAIHLYTNYFFHWHSIPFGMLTIGIFCCLVDLTKVSLKNKVIPLLIYITFSIFLHVRAFNFVFFNKSKTCEISPTKVQYLKQMRTFIKEQKDGTAFLMTSGMIPWTMHPRFKMHQWGEYPSNRTNFDVIIFEKTNKGVHSRNSNEAIEDASRICQGTEVVLNNDYVFAAKGPFSPECITLRHE